MNTLNTEDKTNLNMKCFSYHILIDHLKFTGPRGIVHAY